MKELCDRKSYTKTAKKLEFEVEKATLEDFVRYIKEKRLKPKFSGLSFQVRLFAFLHNYENFQLNLDVEENIKRKIEVEIPTRKKVTKRKAETPSAEVIPEKFKKHVLSLGFQESDVTVLYENKDDWMGIQTGMLTQLKQVFLVSIAFQ